MKTKASFGGAAQVQKTWSTRGIVGHVAGAAGFDALQSSTTSKFVEDLRSRGVKIKYY